MANHAFHESYPLANLEAGAFTWWGVGTLPIYGFHLGTTLPFKSAALLWRASGTTAKSMSFSFGIYSMNGSTLSLANSASGSIANAASATSWVSMALSATMDLSAGHWYTGMIFSTAGSSRMSVVGRQGYSLGAKPGGKFIYGARTASVTNIPAAIATTDTGISTANLSVQPYVIIGG